MLLLGLTGSIATGKSTVSEILRSPPHSLPVVDADVIARQVVEPGTAGYKAIVDYFAGSVPDLLLPTDDPACGGREDGPDGKGRPLNRPALGRAVFGGGEEQVKARKVLNGIVHPAVRRAMWKQVVRF
jgi:dephospho-CoA kinase